MEEERNQWEGRPFRLISFDRLSPMQRIYTYDETNLNDEGDDIVTKPLRMCTQEMDGIDVGSMTVEKREDGIWITDVQYDVDVRGQELLPAGFGRVEPSAIFGGAERVVCYRFDYAYIDTGAENMDELKAIVREEKMKMVLD